MYMTDPAPPSLPHLGPDEMLMVEVARASSVFEMMLGQMNVQNAA